MWTDFRKRVTDCGRNRHFYKVPEVSLLTVDHRLPFLKEKCSGYKIDIHTHIYAHTDSLCNSCTTPTSVLEVATAPTLSMEGTL